MRLTNLTGRQFGRWVVVRYAGQSKWLCRCSCGKTGIIFGKNLKNSLSRSCGCLRDELAGSHHRTHGLSRTSEYFSWRMMIVRCTDPAHATWADYGGRGITVCRRWMGDNGFQNFLRDLGKRPSGTTLERIKNDKGYSPKNCRWATRKEQSRNQRSNVWLRIDGVRYCLRDACEHFGMNYSTARKRIRLGWSVRAAVMTPTRKSNDSSRNLSRMA